MKKYGIITIWLMLMVGVSDGQTINGTKAPGNYGILEMYLAQFKSQYLDTLRKGKLIDENISPTYSAKLLNRVFKGEICADPRLLRNCNFEVVYAANDIVQLGIIEIRYKSKTALSRAKLLVKKGRQNFPPNSNTMIPFVLLEKGNYLVFLLSGTPLDKSIYHFFSQAK